jgi:ankyrin repeat protein
MTALILAAEKGQEEVARLLLEHGAEVDRWTTSRGMTALMFAAANRVVA